MLSRGFTTGEFVAQQAEREDTGEIQAFIESNPEYWLLVHGHPPLANDAAESFDWHPPADMSCSEHLSFLVRHSSTRQILAQIDVATDLPAPGVYVFELRLKASEGIARVFSARWSVGALLQIARQRMKEMVNE